MDAMAEDTDSSLIPAEDSRKRSDTDLGLGTFNLFFGPDTAATNTYTHICSLSIFSFLSSFITTNQISNFSNVHYQVCNTTIRNEQRPSPPPSST